uniref:Uncharacterized protein n=1 Tax=viral metagenome TaxID=1070528 RepID=A0A6C0H5T3_9ZZZZ
MIKIIITSNGDTEYDDYLMKRIKQKDFTDTCLSSRGKAYIKENSKKLLEKMPLKMDIAFISPYTKSVETIMETYKECKTIPSIYAMTLLGDRDDSMENVGLYQEDLIKKYGDIDFEEVFWEKNDMNDKKWWNNDFQRDLSKRVKLFEEFMYDNKDELINKNIHVITNNSFIEEIIKRPITNYQSFMINYDVVNRKWTPSFRSIRALF